MPRARRPLYTDQRSQEFKRGTHRACVVSIEVERVTAFRQLSNFSPSARAERLQRPVGPHYKWIVLTNTTLGALMASIDGSIVLIALPAIFKGIGINPLAQGESSYFLWLLLGYMVVTTTLLVAVRTHLRHVRARAPLQPAASPSSPSAALLLAFTPGTGNAGALELIIFRLIQGVGAGFLFANSAAILTDAFPLQPAWARARHQPDCRHRRVIHRARSSAAFSR